MEIQNLSYLLLLLVFLIIPAVLSTKSKVRFVFQLKYLLPAIIFTEAIFVMWNKRFIELGIWEYNPNYITGIEFLAVPIEEWISFLIIPLSTAYIYEWLKIKFEKFEQANIFVALSLVIFAFSGVFAYASRQNLFTFFTFFLTAIYLGYMVFRNRFKKHFTKFYMAYFIALLPFFTVSLIMNALPVIIYNSDHIKGLAITGVPVEKLGYLFLMLLITISSYEYLNKRQYY